MNKVKVNNTTQALMIDGASCASCVSKIETALLSIEGVDRAQMNFAQRTVLVTGHANIDELIKTVEAIGYNAKSSNNASDEQLLNEKEVADQKYYRRLIQQMWVSLGLGAPLMIYSLAGGPMTVDTTLERFIWLFIGLLCVVIMYFSGSIFMWGRGNLL